MNPTNEQKLIILMLADIAEKVGADTHFDPSLVSKAISHGSGWMLPFKYAMQFPDAETPFDVSFVINVLDMFEFLERAVESLPAADQAEVAAAPGGYALKFRGFDGNNESEHMSIADHLSSDLELFQTFAGRDLNSHCPMVEGYSRMYSVFERIRPNLIGREMNKSEVLAVAAEAVHPENR